MPASVAAVACRAGHPHLLLPLQRHPQDLTVLERPGAAAVMERCRPWSLLQSWPLTCWCSVW